MSAATPVTVRPATETDLPALLALYGELNPDDAPWWPKPTAPWPVRRTASS
ncbi:hypothetical protein SUDANB105_06753 [Streptomyces sp. enrichment culture]|uniref:hypothetical protein n=1 Tax=Streptomyces sp. enrichment culture TaxID=1795815 RepID=UPI003F553BAB